MHRALRAPPSTSDTSVTGLAPQQKVTLLEMLHRKLLQALQLMQANNITLQLPKVWRGQWEGHLSPACLECTAV